MTKNISISYDSKKRMLVDLGGYLYGTRFTFILEIYNTVSNLWMGIPHCYVVIDYDQVVLDYQHLRYRSKSIAIYTRHILAHPSNFKVGI